MGNGLITIVSGILFCFGLLMLYIVATGKTSEEYRDYREYIEYTFEYTYIERVGDSDVKTVTKNCVAFNFTKTDIKAVTRKYIEDYDKKGELLIRESCETSFLATPVHPRLTYDLDANNVLIGKANY